MTSFGDPVLDRLGLRPAVAGATPDGRIVPKATVAASGGAIVPPSGGPGYQDLAFRFPGVKVLRAGFDQVPLGGYVSAAASWHAWYKLASWQVGGPNLPGEYLLMHGCMSLMPTDWNGKGSSGEAASAVAWGDNRGLRAAIVVGVNLPGGPGQAWESAPYYGVGVGYPLTTLGTIPAQQPEYLFVSKFPGGEWTDTIPQTTIVPRSFAPAGRRLAAGENLDVCLVLNGTQAASVANDGKYIHGFADIQLGLVETANSRALSQ